MKVLEVRVGRRWYPVIELRRGQVHQVYVTIQGDWLGFKHGDQAVLNLNTNELILIKRETENEQAA